MPKSIIAVLLAGALCVLGPPPAHADSWPAFRGPTGDGHAASGETASLPATWTETENVTWKTATPHIGFSTPVIMGGKVWLTTATEAGNDYYVIGLDSKTGKIICNEHLFHHDNPDPLSNNVNGYASPTSVVEPGRLYVHFGSYGTACIDTESHKVLWKQESLECRHHRGPGSSTLLFENLLILTFDGADPQYVVALDKKTGDIVWRADRSTVWDDLDENGQPKATGDFRKGFSTPMVVDVDGTPVLVSVGSSTAFGYDARTGREIWKVRNPSHTPSASPIVMGKTAFITTGYGGTEMRAIRLDGEGDVTDSHVTWKQGGKHIPSIPSPILIDGLIYSVSDRGETSCLDAATGEEVWTDRFGGSFMASPVYADGKIYFCSMQGKAQVIEPGRTFKLLAENELGAGFMASPAVADGALFLRTKSHLYRIEEK